MCVHQKEVKGAVDLAAENQALRSQAGARMRDIAAARSARRRAGLPVNKMTHSELCRRVNG